MKKLLSRLLRSTNVLLASMIAALGVVGCSHQKNLAKQAQNQPEDENSNVVPEEIISSDEQQMVCMYGVPRAEYVVHGKVADAQGKPAKQKTVSIRSRYNEIRVETDENGVFEIRFDGFPENEMIFEIDGEQYTEPVVYDGEALDAWNRGTATMQVNIILGRNARPVPVMVKYGVPPIRETK